jgi:hypothetical protein
MIPFYEHRIPASRLSHWASINADAPSLIYDEVHAFAFARGIKATDAEMSILDDGYIFEWPIPMKDLLKEIDAPQSSLPKDSHVFDAYRYFTGKSPLDKGESI